MELDERKIRILEAIIQNYLVTGGPVGSRTISKDAGLSVSSATIRNEMADLEDMGYIVQPHTSAGRVPTDKGYRLYVDYLVSARQEAIQEKDEIIKRREAELRSLRYEFETKSQYIDDVMTAVAKLLATDTNYATVISSACGASRKLKFVQLSKLEDNRILVVIVLEGNDIRNKVFTVSKPISDNNILKLNMMLNTSITGLSVDELKTRLEESEEYSRKNELVREVLHIIFETVHNADDVQIYTSGTTNIFKYPELSDSEIAQELISELEEKQGLTTLISNNSNCGNEIQFYIGEETPIKAMKNCSVVTAAYELFDGTKGTIGIIGPKRMDYEMVVETLNNIRMRLDYLFGKNDL